MFEIGLILLGIVMIGAPIAFGAGVVMFVHMVAKDREIKHKNK